MTKEEFTKLRWLFAASMAFEHYHEAKYFCAKIDDLQSYTITYKKKDGSFGKSHTEYVFRNKIYTNVTDLLVAMMEWEERKGLMQ